ncbi:Amino acid permease [Arachis hypogaea]|nr:Amino acid permease [Arachis hypogaea]
MIDENASAAATTTVSHHHDASLYDDDGRPKRRGTVWTVSSHIITAVIGSGVLSVAWSIAQLDPITGKRSYTYMEAIGNILGKYKQNYVRYASCLSKFL